jgi:hypothetical protein
MFLIICVPRDAPELGCVVGCATVPARIGPCRNLNGRAASAVDLRTDFDDLASKRANLVVKLNPMNLVAFSTTETEETLTG